MLFYKESLFPPIPKIINYRLIFITLLPIALPVLDAYLIEISVKKSYTTPFLLKILIAIAAGWLISLTFLYLLSNGFKIVGLRRDTIKSLRLVSVTLLLPIFFVLFVLPLPRGSEGAGGVTEGFTIWGMMILIALIYVLALIISILISLRRMAQLVVNGHKDAGYR